MYDSIIKSKNFSFNMRYCYLFQFDEAEKKRAVKVAMKRPNSAAGSTSPAKKLRTAGPANTSTPVAAAGRGAGRGVFR